MRPASDSSRDDPQLTYYDKSFPAVFKQQEREVASHTIPPSYIIIKETHSKERKRQDKRLTLEDLMCSSRTCV